MQCQIQDQVKQSHLDAVDRQPKWQDERQVWQQPLVQLQGKEGGQWQQVQWEGPQLVQGGQPGQVCELQEQDQQSGCIEGQVSDL